MNCPAKTEPILPDGHNQSPNDLCSDLTTRSDLGKLANARLQREHRLSDPDETSDTQIIPQPPTDGVDERGISASSDGGGDEKLGDVELKHAERFDVAEDDIPGPKTSILARWTLQIGKVIKTYVKFMGPGFMVAVVSPLSIQH